MAVTGFVFGVLSWVAVSLYPGGPPPSAHSTGLSPKLPEHVASQPREITFSRLTLRAQEAWNDCLVDELITLYRQQERASVVADVALLNCQRLEPAYEQGVARDIRAQDPDADPTQASDTFRALRLTRRSELIASVMNLRRGR